MTAGLLATLLVTLSGVLGGLYWISVDRKIEQMKARVAEETRTLVAIDRRQGQEALARALLSRRTAPDADVPFDALIGADGRLIEGNFPTWPKPTGSAWLRIEADLYRDGDEDDHEVLSRDVGLAEGRRLIVGRDIEVLADREELIVQTALWGLIALLFVGPIGGLLVSNSVARRLDDISGAALAVMEGDLGGRIPVKGSGDDFDRLAKTLNAMLDRIEELVASVARVSDHVAHELRTPLARLRASLETAARVEGMDEKAALADRNLAEVVRLQATLDALLRVARLDSGRHTIGRGDVQLDRLVRDAVDFYAPEAEARDQALTASLGETTVRGDPDLLFQAVANLIDNAVKFTPRGGAIDVRIEVFEDGPILSIRDSGPGVAVENIARLTERFYRAPGTEPIEGSGLGLSLVDSIARAHSARLSFAGTAGSFEAILDFRTTDSSKSRR